MWFEFFVCFLPLSLYSVVTSVATTIGLLSLANGMEELVALSLSGNPSRSANMPGGFSVPDIRMEPETCSKIGPTGPASIGELQFFHLYRVRRIPSRERFHSESSNTSIRCAKRWAAVHCLLLHQPPLR